MTKLSKTEAELEKIVAYKKGCNPLKPIHAVSFSENFACVGNGQSLNNI